MAGTASGVGKTTVVLAVTAALRRRGLRVQVFKGGPDFLDTGHHTRISGRAARNVDTWMLPAEANRAVVAQAAADAEVALGEGMMGLFDGKNGTSNAGSSAEMATLLGMPVVLVVDAAKSARSVAAVVLGFELFDPELRLAGVVLNRVASERHAAMLEAAIGARCRTPVLGWMAREPRIAIAERHLGLHTAEENDTAELQESLAEAAEAHLDLDRMLGLEFELPVSVRPPASLSAGERVRIGVARDRAFSFLYEDNLDLLRAAGAEIVPFSPLMDAALPDGLDALYLGGGYPELYAERLSANRSMLEEVRAFAASGRPVYAECGGMIYLGRALTTLDDKVWPMAGVLQATFAMTEKLVKFGYVTVELTRDCLVGSHGERVRGHSFHYSRMVEAPACETAYAVSYSLSGMSEAEGFTTGTVLASYVHLHFRAAPGAAERLVQAARAARVVEVVAR